MPLEIKPSCGITYLKKLYLALILNKIKLIILLLCLLPGVTKASHILGGEITYTHISDLKYKIQTIIYRDCNGCKLMGAGGGASNVDCGKIDLFLATSYNSTCGRQTLTKLNIERKKIVELLPTCENVKTKCVANSTMNFGVEAHYFEVEIDFENYGSYKNCSFDIYTNISWRTKGISTIDDDQPFYNYAKINPWIKHNSPSLKSEISPIVFCNQPVLYSHAGTDVDKDSLSFHMVPALSDYNKNISYKAGYNSSNPLDVYCPDIPCVANPNTFPPQGFNFNPFTGDITFTPTNCGQTGLLVLEVKKWRKINGKQEVISVVRRDLQYIVLNGSENNPPVFSKPFGTIEVCAGEEICFDIDVQDAQYIYPDNSKGPQDNVSLTWDAAISGASFEQKNTNESGKFKGRFCWKTSVKDASENVYLFTVFANDGNCPLNAVSSRTYQILVKPKPEVTLSKSKLECGYLELSSSSNANIVQNNWKVGLVNNTNYDANGEGSKLLYKAHLEGKYYLYLQSRDINNCLHVIHDTLQIAKDDLVGFNILSSGQSIVCDGDSINLMASVNNGYVVNSYNWKKSGVVLSNQQVFSKLADINTTNGLLTLTINATKNERVCIDSVQLNLLVNPLPIIDGLANANLCYLKANLNEIFGVTPTGGIWKSDEKGILLNENQIDEYWASDRTQNKKIAFSYHVVSNTTGCKNEKVFNLNLLPLPTLTLQDASLCKGIGNFYIDNLVLNPASQIEQKEVLWRVKNDLLNLERDSSNNRFYINPDIYADDDYHIYAQRKGQNGCISYDTALLTLLNNLVITYNGKDTFCGGIEQDLNAVLGISTKNGGWYCATNSDWMNGNKISANACGPINLSYTYDRFGCFDQLNLNVFAECMDDIVFTNKFDTICNAYEAFKLHATPLGGAWRGPGIVNDIFNPNGLNGKFILSYEVRGKACKKTSDYPIWVIDAPTIDDSKLQSTICEGQEWDVSKLVLNAKKTSLVFGEGAVKLDDLQTKILAYIPSAAEINKGEFNPKLTVNNGGLCNALHREYKIKISQKPLVNLLKINGCVPYKTRISPTIDHRNSPIDKWNWSLAKPELFTSVLHEPMVQFSQVGVFDASLQVTNKDQCVYNYLFDKIIQINPAPTAAFESTPDYFASVLNPVFQFTNKSITQGKSTYNWHFGTANINHVSNAVHPIFTYPADTGKYLVTLQTTNEFGCSEVASKWVSIGPDIEVFIPNAFTPDQKGPEVNATYNVIANNVKAFELIIINRWGEVVFHSNDIKHGWDGNLAGTRCLPGVYVYQIKIVSRTGKTYDYNGTLNLIR